VSGAPPEELGEAVSAALSRNQQQVLLGLRGFANEAGVAPARAAMFEALASIDECQKAVRVQQDAEKAARAAAADAVVEAEWEIRDRRVVKEGSKTFWVTDDDETEMVEGDDGTAAPQPTDRKIRKQLTADEARDRLALEVRKHHAVREAEEALRAAEEATAAARDRLALAERRFSACKADVNAATAQLTALANTLPLVLQESTR
jgi:hypothetical protein